MDQQQAKAVLPSVAKRYKDEEVIDIMNRYYGNNSMIVAALGCTYQQFNVWLRNKESRREALATARKKIVDKSEEKMLKLLDSDDPKVVLETAKFILKHLGRDRGYYGDSPMLNVAVQKGANDDIKVQVQALFGLTDGEEK